MKEFETPLGRFKRAVSIVLERARLEGEAATLQYIVSKINASPDLLPGRKIKRNGTTIQGLETMAREKTIKIEWSNEEGSLVYLLADSTEDYLERRLRVIEEGMKAFAGDAYAKGYSIKAMTHAGEVLLYDPDFHTGQQKFHLCPTKGIKG